MPDPSILDCNTVMCNTILIAAILSSPPRTQMTGQVAAARWRWRRGARPRYLDYLPPPQWRWRHRAWDHSQLSLAE